MTATVYIIWNDRRRPLYVGCTEHLAQRLRQHNHWLREIGPYAVATLEFSTLAEALEVEAHYIGKLRPPRNSRHNPARRCAAEAQRAVFYRSALAGEGDPYELLTVHDRKWMALRDLRRLRDGAAA